MSLSLDPAELTITFVRASGPGGQNVNKVSTAAQLRFDLMGSPSLPEPVKAWLYAGNIEAVSAGKLPWYDLMQRPGLVLKRPNPTIDSGGYRAIFVFDLADSTSSAD